MTVPDACKVPPLAAAANLITTDDNGREDFAAWLRCPIAAEDTAAAGTPCCIQRRELRNISVLDIDHNVIMTVRRLACSAHKRADRQACSFFVTHPAVLEQLQSQGIHVLPGVIALTTQTVVTTRAYMCALCAPDRCHVVPLQSSRCMQMCSWL